MTYLRSFIPAFLIALTISFAAFSSASAQDAIQSDQGDILPVRGTEVSVSEDTKNTQYPDLLLTPDKPYLLSIDTDAANIIVGNTDHMDVIPDSTRRMVLVPKREGTTYLQIIDDAGQVIMERHVIIGVAKPAERYVRIRRSCNEGSKNCESTSVYYCPGMCHRMDVSGAETQGPTDAVSGRFEDEDVDNVSVENEVNLGNNAPASLEP